MAGQSMMEYLIILPTLLLLVLASIQFGLLYQIKSQLNYATFIAARQGAMKNGSSSAIKDAFASGMTPLFSNSPDLQGMLRGRAVGAIEAFNPLVTTIERVSPPASVMTDFGISDPLNSSKKLLPNDNLQYRSTAVGANSKINIQDANLLKIRVTYCAKMVVPIANVVIYSLLNGIEGVKTVGGRFFADVDQTIDQSNTCSQLKHKYGAKVAQGVGGIDALLGTSMETEVMALLVKVSDAINTFTIPGLNWGVGGYRIPVTAEAVVRMQSPLKL